MPPKKERKGDKKDKKVKSTGPTVKELQVQIVALESLKDKEASSRNAMQLERDKIQAFWNVKTEEYEKLKAELKIKDRYAEELEEKHQDEIKVYNQKMKHLLYEQEHLVASVKISNEQALKLQADQAMVRQTQLIDDIRHLKELQKEMEVSHEEIIRQLKLERDKQITKMRHDFDIQAKLLEDKCAAKIEVLREELELRRKNEVHEVEERKNKHINDLMKKQEKAFTEIKCYYNDITKNNLDLIKTLKEDVIEMKKKEALNEKLMFEIAQENKKLVDPLQKALLEVETLKRALTGHEKDKALLNQRTVQFNERTEELKELEWQYQELQERLGQAQLERDDVIKKFESSVYEVQQKCGLKNIVLEKKVQLLSENLEKKDTQINHLAAEYGKEGNNVDAAKRSIETLLNEKNRLIKSLRYDLGRIAKAHNDLVKAFEIKLAEFGIPLQEMGLPHYMSNLQN